jgi:hypothetical protein
VRLEASTKPHVQNLIHEFLINIAFTMAYPNFKKGLEMVFEPLGVNPYFVLDNFSFKTASNHPFLNQAINFYVF